MRTKVYGSLLAAALFISLASTHTLGQSQQQEPDDSTIVYPASFFEPYNPNSASDMLDRIPGISLSGGGGGRGLGTGGDLLINGQRLAGKDNSPRAQLDRIAAREVERIEIIRGTSGDLDVRGASQVVNVVLVEAHSRSATTVELVTRLNHDNHLELGGSLTQSQQIGNFQAMLNIQSRPNYENREDRETRLNAAGQPVGTMFQSNIRDQAVLQMSGNMGYRTGAHRMQLNVMYGDSSHPRDVRRDFLDFAADDFTDSGDTRRVEIEHIKNDFDNWEIGGDYEYVFERGHRAQLLFITNDQTRDNIRERFAVNPEQESERSKNLFIDSRQRTRERIAQGNYSLPLGMSQDLRVGLEQAHTQLDSTLLIGTLSGSAPPSPAFGGLTPRPELSNPGTTVEEMRVEGFVFHNWQLNSRMSLESSLVYETSEISQTGVVDNRRTFDFLRPSLDYRFNVTDSLQLRANAERIVSQLSFANFAATTNDADRERDADAGNPELAPERGNRYQLQLQYRLPNDNGVLTSRVVYREIENYIGRINATTNPNQPLSAIGNVGPAVRKGFFNNASTRLGFVGLPDAILSVGVSLFDSEVIDPFLGTPQRISDRGSANIGFRHDVPLLALNYGIDYRHHFHGGRYNTDITTITRNDAQPALNLFVSRVFFDDYTVRLESDNTLRDARCQERRRYSPNTITGSLSSIEQSCSSRYQRVTLRMQTTF